MGENYRKRLIFRKRNFNEKNSTTNGLDYLRGNVQHKFSALISKNAVWTMLVAVLSASAGGATAWIALMEWNSKQEKMSILISQDKNCNVSEIGGSLALCWEAYIVNKSLTKTSLIALEDVDRLVPENVTSVEEIQEWRIFEISDFFAFYDDLGKKVALPITLDGGEARKYKAKMYVRLPSRSIQAAQSIYDQHKTDLFKKTLQEYEMEMIWKFKVDLLGRIWEGNNNSRSISENYRNRRYRMEIVATTSRGSAETTSIDWY